MKKIILLSILTLPVVAQASDNGLNEFVGRIAEVFDSLYALAFVVVGVAFAWGVIAYVFSADKDADKLRSRLLWPIVALFILFSIWGIITFLRTATGIDSDNESITAPSIKAPTPTKTGQ